MHDNNAVFCVADQFRIYLIVVERQDIDNGKMCQGLLIDRAASNIVFINMIPPVKCIEISSEDILA